MLGSAWPKRRACFVALIWWWSGRIVDVHWTSFGSACIGKKIPDISISGNETIREKRTAIPSLFAIRPIISPSVVFMIPMNNISCKIARGLIAYLAPVNMKRIRMIRNWTRTRIVKKISFAKM